MDTYERDRQERLGERGNPIFARTRETTDLDDMRERSVETTGTCYCGRPVAGPDALRRCVNCDLLCCRSCQVVVRRQVVCQQCAERGFGLDKEVFLVLYLLDRGLVRPDRLVEVAVDDEGEPVKVRVDSAAASLWERGYVTGDGALSPRGREAMQVGEQLYIEERDVQRAIQDARIRQVADR